MSPLGAVTDDDRAHLAPLGRFPEIRAQLDDAYQHVSDVEIEAWVPEVFPDLTADELEGFLKSLKSFGRTAGRTIAKAAPGAISGAMQGATMGMAAGPYGALIGAGVGALGGGIGGLAAPTSPAQPRPAPAPTTLRPRATPPPPGTAPAPAPAATPGQLGNHLSAAMQLLQFISQPAVLQALTSMAMQPGGRDHIDLGGYRISNDGVVWEMMRLSNAVLAESAVRNAPHPSHHGVPT